MNCPNGYALLLASCRFNSYSVYNQERVTYNKEIQTTDFEEPAQRPDEEEIRERIFHERDLLDAERAREKELEEESVQLDNEIEKALRGECLQQPAVCVCYLLLLSNLFRAD